MLIRQMGRANPTWGAPRIHGELLKLGIEIAETTVAHYLVRRHPPPSQTFQALTAAPLEGPPARAADAPPVRVHRGARRRRLRPIPPPAIWLGDVGAQVECRQVHEHLITVVPLVGDDLVDDRRVLVGHGGHGFQLFGRRGHRLRDRSRVALIGTLHSHADNGAGL